MAMLDRSKKQKIITGSFTLCLGLCAFLLFGMVMVVSASLSSVSSSTSAHVGFGPLKLVELSKSPVANGGYSASIAFQKGLIIYVLIALTVAVVLAYVRLVRSSKA